MHKIKKKEVMFVRCFAKTAGVSAFSFGVGVALCLVLPTCALLCVEASLIIGIGVVLFLK